MLTIRRSTIALLALSLAACATDATDPTGPQAEGEGRFQLPPSGSYTATFGEQAGAEVTVASPLVYFVRGSLADGSDMTALRPRYGALRLTVAAPEGVYLLHVRPAARGPLYTAGCDARLYRAGAPDTDPGETVPCTLIAR